MPSFLIKSLLLALLLSVGSLRAQLHVAPEDEAFGIPGLEENSFVIIWREMEGAVAYEYVISDNSFCFSGCGGDTRQNLVGDTFAIEYELIAEKAYYWITRVLFEDGSYSDWSLISTFFTRTPELRPFVSISPNPASCPITLLMDWAANEKARSLSLTFYNQWGHTIFPKTVFNGGDSALRQDQFLLPCDYLRPGLYFALISVFDRRGALIDKRIEKILIR